MPGKTVYCALLPPPQKKSLTRLKAFWHVEASITVRNDIGVVKWFLGGRTCLGSNVNGWRIQERKQLEMHKPPNNVVPF